MGVWRRLIRTGLAATAAAGWLAAIVLTADSANAETSADRELEAAYQAAFSAMIPGPGTIKLASQATIAIGADDGFVPSAQAVRLMRATGNGGGDSVLGLVVSRNGRWNWFIAVEFDAIGYAPAAQLARLDKDAVYDLIRKATLRGNAHRNEQGSASLDLAGFVEPPAYDTKLDRLFVATRLVKAGTSDGREDIVNLDAHVFGREGVLTLSLATNVSGYANLRPHMEQIYVGAAFVPGKRSADAMPDDRRTKYLPEMLFSGQSADDVLKDKAAAAALAQSQARIAAAAEDSDRSWRAYLFAAIGSLTISAIAAFFMMRSSPA